MVERDPTQQLQQAALEAVRAARAVLDAAEAVISDPASLESLVRSATSVARTTGQTVLGFAAGMTADRAGPARSPSEPATDDAADGDDPDDGFHRIVVD